jgi:acyl-CoA reductase-like NAD-dependent aldehyde dehydrogenase
MKKTDRKLTKKLKERETQNGREQFGGLPVLKTYKLFIDGTFPRSESGRYYPVENKKNGFNANISRASRKDLREAVVAARKALAGWNNRTAYNKSQIVYRLAEMLVGRIDQLVQDLINGGFSRSKATEDVKAVIDRTVYYAGWCDKYQQLYSSVNPVSGSYFNFSIPEPVGVVGLVTPPESGLLAVVGSLLPVIVGSNAAILLAPHNQAMASISLAESLATSDFPGGVVNILTGFEEELIGHFTSHMDIDAFVYCGDSPDNLAACRERAASNVKRIIDWSGIDWKSSSGASPYLIMDLQEIKTTWHPIGK